MLKQLLTNNDNHGHKPGFLGYSIWGLGIIFSILLFMNFIGCEDNKILSEAAPGFIGGTVTDSLTGQPIYQAWVSHDSLYDSRSVLTDTSGYYVLNAGFPGINRVAYCGKSGYISLAKGYSVSSRDTTMVNFRLIRE